MRRIGLVLLVGLLYPVHAVAGEPDGHGAESPLATPAAKVPAKASKPVSKTSASKAKTSTQRSPVKVTRSRGGAKMVGHVVPESKLRSSPLPRPSGNVHLTFLGGGHDSIKINIFNPDGSYNVEALGEVSHVLRCKRTDTEKDIEPRLLTVLSHVYDHFGEKAIQVVSGFRNQRRTTSYHYKGSATDIRIAGVSPTKLRAFVESLDAGGMGIGLYPRTGFVHVDVRPPPSYRWIDWSRSDPDSPDKRPPTTLKKKKLQS